MSKPLILYQRAVDVDFFLLADLFFSLDCRICCLLNWNSLGELNLSINFYFFFQLGMSVVDQAINDICIKLECSRNSLHVVWFLIFLVIIFYNVNSKYVKKHAMHVWTICIMLCNIYNVDTYMYKRMSMKEREWRIVSGDVL